MRDRCNNAQGNYRSLVLYFYTLSFFIHWHLGDKRSVCSGIAYDVYNIFLNKNNSLTESEKNSLRNSGWIAYYLQLAKENKFTIPTVDDKKNL